MLQRLAHADTSEGLLNVAATEGLLPDLAGRHPLVLNLLRTRHAAAARSKLDRLLHHGAKGIARVNSP